MQRIKQCARSVIDTQFEETQNKEKPKIAYENDFKEMTLKDLTSQNLTIIDELNKGFALCMEQICDDYAAKYGNECNVQ